MPSFYVDDIKIDVLEFLSECNRDEINEIILELSDSGYIPKYVLGANSKNDSRIESEFSEKMDILKTKYYSLTTEEETFLNNLFRKYT